MPDPKLPPDLRLSANPDSPPITFADNLSAEFAHFHQPELVGIACQIQHPTVSGKAPSKEPGMLGCGIVITPDGPIFIVSVRHADGTSLAAMLQPEDYIGFAEIYIPLGVQATQAMHTMGTPAGEG